MKHDFFGRYDSHALLLLVGWGRARVSNVQPFATTVFDHEVPVRQDYVPVRCKRLFRSRSPIIHPGLAPCSPSRRAHTLIIFFTASVSRPHRETSLPRNICLHSSVFYTTTEADRAFNELLLLSRAENSGHLDDVQCVDYSRRAKNVSGDRFASNPRRHNRGLWHASPMLRSWIRHVRYAPAACHTYLWTEMIDIENEV